MEQTTNTHWEEDEVAVLGERLAEAVSRMTNEDGKIQTQVPGLSLTRWNDTSKTDVCFYAPAIGLIVQGKKESLIGSEVFRYGAMDSLVNGVDMPSTSRILDATPERPLLAVSLEIDRALATELSAQIPPVPGFVDPLGVSIARVNQGVLDAFTRLVELLEHPEHLSLRAPLLIREIITRVLMGPQGASLRKIYTVGSHSNQVAAAVTWLRENYVQPLRVEELADRVGMATSTFHRQFKKVTSVSPVQYQKYLRLYEAQRLMLAEGQDANNAGRAVGYDNIQQFSREYKRMFGEPPHRDIKRIRKEHFPVQHKRL